MKYAASFLILIAIPFCALAQSAQSDQLKPVSFDDLPQIILERNESFKAARVSVQAQEERTGHLTRSFLPRINANIGEENYETSSNISDKRMNWNVGASLNLYRGGKDNLEEDIREARVDEARIESSKDYQSQLRRARESFLELVSLEKLLSYRKEELKKNEENLKSANRRAGAGVTSTADANQFELYRMDLEQRVKRLEIKIDVSRRQLAVLLGRSDHTAILVQSDFPTRAKAEIKSLQVANQLDVKAQRTKEKIEALQAKQSARWWHPELDLYASHGIPTYREDITLADRNDRETTVGVRLSFDLGQGLNDVSESKARTRESQSSAMRASFKEREASAADYELRRDLQLSEEMIALNEKSITKASQFLKTTQSEYARGVKNGPDLLSAFRQLYDLLDRSVELNREFFTSKSRLDSLLANSEAL